MEAVFSCKVAVLMWQQGKKNGWGSFFYVLQKCEEYIISHPVASLQVS